METVHAQGYERRSAIEYRIEGIGRYIIVSEPP